VLVALLAVLVAWSPGAVRGETMSYNISISSSYAMLQSPNSAMSEQEVAGQSAHVYWVCSDSPVVEITNTGTSGITNLTLTLNQPNDVIEALKIMSPTTGATAEGVGAGGFYATPTTSLDISLAGAGLATGKSLIFALELGPTKGYSSSTWVPGYQNGMFDSADPGLNAGITVTYASPGDAPTTLDYTLPPIADLSVVDSVTTCCNLTTTLLTGTLTPIVPEPSSIVALAGMGGLGLLICLRRRRTAQSRT
jgi:hypothetical protein